MIESKFGRRSGILLHPTSLPSHGGIGDLGPAAYAFADFLQAAGQRLWQILPLNPVGLGNSPYSAISAFAGNPLLISLETLAKHDWIKPQDLKSLPNKSGNVDFKSVHSHKLPLLRTAARNFIGRPRDSFGEHDRFDHFCKENAWWLEDFVLFDCLRTHYGAQSWNKWPHEMAARSPEALARVRKDFADQLQVERVLQFAFFEQWGGLRKYCAERDIRVVGDVAIFVNFDSADVWTHPEIFYLNPELEPEIVAGVPPDAFSKTGQRWGNPLYRWDVLRSRGYDWWVQRMKWALTTCDIIRLDHFRGFQQYWEIPGHEPTAIHGKWVDGPKDDLFNALRSALGDLPFIAEDLGLITPDVVELRVRMGMPGMKVLQFGFSDRGAHIYLPHKYESNCVAYTGTHDNDTTLGWWKELNDAERKQVRAYVGEQQDGINWALIRTVEASPAVFAILPLQDVLGLGNEARMNTPSRIDDNWGWRFQPDALKAELAKKMHAIADVCDRIAEEL
ncbi:MAG: 4-alpha-glucanotransferase [Acidobacteriaceae bacterium]|nr:4-alpha-glucanotransferase [Acidobacteriaceae bacterium]